MDNPAETEVVDIRKDGPREPVLPHRDLIPIIIINMKEEQLG